MAEQEKRTLHVIAAYGDVLAAVGPAGGPADGSPPPPC